ncbi:MAG: hypothetical protein R6W89_04550 [Candidatus Hydrogenedentota bacterium]
MKKSTERDDVIARQEGGGLVSGNGEGSPRRCLRPEGFRPRREATRDAAAFFGGVQGPPA